MDFPSHHFRHIHCRSLFRLDDATIYFLGIYHRFTCDENRLIHAMRLFVGQPIWTPFNRPQEEHGSRKKYVKTFLEEKKED
jgi:1,2-dihydroxy-3-keto-5-methylthiopentene dioxygenase